VVHEFGHHLHETSLKPEFENYKKTVEWTDSNNNRPGKFIRSESKGSPEEDFAVNFETYVLEPKKLKDFVPEAYQWMSSHLKNKYNLKECEK
jgi:hypothetical protein